MNDERIFLNPIGHARTRDGRFFLEILRQYAPALLGLNGFGHVAVLWWSHLCADDTQRNTLVCESPYAKGPSRVGVFATRAPFRPNPISLSCAAVLGIDTDAGRLEVAYLDAEDGTPILDIKPYHPCLDRVRKTSVPAWCAHWPQWYEDSAAFDWAAEIPC